MHKLGPISVRTRAELRHVRLVAARADVDTSALGSDGSLQSFGRTSHLLKFLPGLQLDVLTILGFYIYDESYDALNDLVRQCNGWKELRYIHHDSSLIYYAWKSSLGFTDFENGHVSHWYIRRPQQLQWKTDMEERDGHRSRPTVTGYRKTTTTEPPAVLLQPQKRTTVLQARVREHMYSPREKCLKDSEISERKSWSLSGEEVMVTTQ